MINRKILAAVAAITLIATPLAHADTSEMVSISDTMSPAEYASAQKHNKRVMRNMARDAVIDSLTFVGVSRDIAEGGVNIAGALVGTYVDGAKVNVTDTLSVKVRNLNSDNPDVSLRLSLSW